MVVIPLIAALPIAILLHISKSHSPSFVINTHRNSLPPPPFDHHLCPITSPVYEQAGVTHASNTFSFSSFNIFLSYTIPSIFLKAAVPDCTLLLIFKVSPTPWRCFFLNIGVIDLNFSTHNQFGLKFKFTQFSINLVAMVTKKQDGCHGSNTFSQQRYLKKTITYLVLKPTLHLRVMLNLCNLLE